MFIRYPKIHRLGKEETDGILDGDVVVQEKIDGANTSIWLEDGKICGGSRGRQLGDESFNGFVEYINAHEGISKLLADNPTYRLYGEWLVRHTIAYNETAYRQFYLFDIWVDDRFLGQPEVEAYAQKYGLNYPQVFWTGVIDLDKINEFVGKTNLGQLGEGVVIKSVDFVNAFGDHCYAKVVTEKFKEDNALTFGGNNKHSESYWEMWVINKYCTMARVEKIMNKIQPEVDRRLNREHTAIIIATCYHDLITEEIWEIQKKVPTLNFRKLKGFASKKFAKIFHDILDGHVSLWSPGCSNKFLEY